jgi:hypothetical protein
MGPSANIVPIVATPTPRNEATKENRANLPLLGGGDLPPFSRPDSLVTGFQRALIEVQDAKPRLLIAHRNTRSPPICLSGEESPAPRLREAIDARAHGEGTRRRGTKPEQSTRLARPATSKDISDHQLETNAGAVFKAEERASGCFGGVQIARLSTDTSIPTQFRVRPISES